MQIQDVDFSLELMRAILWQYEDAKNLQGIIAAKQQWYDENQEEFWLRWYRDVFNLYTANDFGLTVWGLILEVSRDAFVGEAREDYPAWGFAGRKNFGRGNFKRTSAGFLKLGTEGYRLLLQLRYWMLVSRGTAPEINAFLKRLFRGQGQAHVIDCLDMSMMYVFTFAPQAWQHFVLQDMDALPRPAGVGVSFRVVNRSTWGFGRHHVNFTRGGLAAAN